MENLKFSSIESEPSNLESEIKNSSNWEQLYAVIENAKVIKGTHERTSFDVMACIDELRNMSADWSTESIESKELVNSPVLSPITRSYGLRGKVAELLVNERKQRNKELVNNILDNEGTVRDRVMLLKLLDEMNGIS